MKLSPEAILLKWVNHQLEKSGVPRRIANFTSDIKDSEAYTHLLYQIAPLELGVTKEALMESDMSSRAEIMLQVILRVIDNYEVVSKQMLVIGRKLFIAFYSFI